MELSADKLAVIALASLSFYAGMRLFKPKNRFLREITEDSDSENNDELKEIDELKRYPARQDLPEDTPMINSYGEMIRFGDLQNFNPQDDQSETSTLMFEVLDRENKIE